MKIILSSKAKFLLNAAIWLFCPVVFGEFLKSNYLIKQMAAEFYHKAISSFSIERAASLICHICSDCFVIGFFGGSAVLVLLCVSNIELLEFLGEFARRAKNARH